MSVTITQAIYAYLNSAWTDISSDVIAGSVSGEWGMRKNSYFDRLAGTGTFTFQLDNSTKKYSPNSASPLSGWDVGVFIKYVITYDGETWVKFYGRISANPKNPGIQLTTGTLGERRAIIKCVDWMDYAANFPIVSKGIQTDITSGAAIRSLLSDMTRQPLATDISTGDNTFPTVFDAAKTTSKTADELSRITFSEMGLCYIKRDKVNGETLVFESNSLRRTNVSVNTIPVGADVAGKLLKEDGGYLLLETGDKIILNEAQDASFDNTMLSANVTYGTNLLNRITIIAYPRLIDTSNQVLFSMPNPLSLAAGETKTFRSGYCDPTGGGRMVSAESTSMVTPVATTDYKMYENSDGTGTDLTANLSVTAVYGTEGVTYTLINTGTTDGWITLLQARGIGVYTNNPIEKTEEDTTSIANYSYQSEIVYQKYVRIPDFGASEARRILYRDKTPRTMLDSITLNANRSSMHMQAFLNLDVGSYIQVMEDQTGIDGKFYIQRVKFQEIEGGIINFTYDLVPPPVLLSDYVTPIAIESQNNPTYPYVSFPSMPSVLNLPQKTICFWLYQIGGTSATWIFGTGGFQVSIDGAIRPQFDEMYDDGNITALGNGTMSPGDAWHHAVIVVKENDTPVFYIDGALVGTVTTFWTITSARTFQEGPVGFFANGTTTRDQKLFDFRIYNSLLMAADVITLYNGGTPSASVLRNANLIFQFPYARNEDVASYIGTDLTTNPDAYPLLDAASGAVGTVTDLGDTGLVGRAAP
jgi:hypothetical protein